MTSNLKKKIIALISLFLVPLTLGSGLQDIGPSLNAPKGILDQNQASSSGVVTDPKQYIGYGYNIASGTALYEPDALMINNPILDTNNVDLQNSIKVFDGSKTQYLSYSSKKVTDVAKQYGKTIGAGAGLGGGYGMFSVNIDAKFNKTGTQSWNKISNEEYSYYTIISGNRPVVLQMNYDELQHYLTPRFKTDLQGVDSELKARNLFNKYGTHLLTGYTLGGIFEMTNYYATSSDFYQKEGNLSFDAQVNAALGSFAQLNGDFSFQEKYGYKNNNSVATNQYKCTTYGGLAFPGLTIDQAFSWYETLGKAGYVYQLWTDSINEGKNLVIVNVPQSSEMIPLWDLLPVDKEYSKAKKLLIETYKTITTNASKDFNNKYQNKYIEGLGNDLNIRKDFEFAENGFTYSINQNHKLFSSYITADNCPPTQRYKIKGDSYIYMDFDTIDYSGQECKWETNQVGLVEVVDDVNGVFKVKKYTQSTPAQFSISFSVNGINLFTRWFEISNLSFSGGDGSELSPYLISNIDELKTFCGNSEYWLPEMHFKLINDINLIGDVKDTHNVIKGVQNKLDPIGNNTNPFEGTFDGNHHTITNFASSKNDTFCMFYANSGVIKNLNLKYENEVNVCNGEGIVSGLVGINKNSGRIENCSVSGFRLRYNNGTNAINGAITSELCIGGIAAASSGTIISCNVYQSLFIVKATDKATNQTPDKRLSRVDIGSLVGLAKSPGNTMEGLIAKSQVEECFIDFDGQELDDRASVNLGGFIGRAAGLKISDNLLKNLTRGNGKDYSINYLTKASVFTMVGGFIGSIVNTNKIKNCISINSWNIMNPYAQPVGFSNTTVGIFVGKDDTHDLNDKKTASEFTSCYIECEKAYPNKDTLDEKEKLPIIFNGIVASELKNANLDINVGDKITKYELPNSITNGQDWQFDRYGIPNINSKKVNYDSLYLDSSLTKTKFYIGEKFTYNNLSIKGLYTTGEELIETSVIVDASAFNGDVEQSQCPIYVEALGITEPFVYKVNVVPPETDHIYAVASSGHENDKYFEGENNFNPNSIVVHHVTKNGIDTVIPYDETGENGYTYLVNQNGFELGTNKVEINYNGFTCNYNVDAEVHEVKNIQVIKDTIFDENNLQKVGSTNIDFSDLNVKVNYVDNQSKIIKGDECVFIYSRISEGKNDITATYKIENADVFEVEGSYFVDDQLIADFINAVNNIDINASLADQFSSINAANDLLDKIDKNYTGDTIFNEAKDKLNSAITNYNNIINGINSNFGENVKISNSFNIFIAGTAGLTILGAIIALIIKSL